MRKRFRDGKFRRRLWSAASVGCVLSSFIAPVRAVDVTWEGDVSLNWATADNWDTGVLPTLDDDAIIGTGQVIELDSDVGDANNVRLGGGSTLAITATGALNVITDFSVGSDAESPGALEQSGGSLAVGQFLRIGDLAAGTATFSGGTTLVGSDGSASAVLAGSGVDSTITISGGDLVQADVDPDNGDSLNYFGVGPGGVTTIDVSAGSLSMFASTIFGQGGATTVVNQSGGVVETRERSVRLASGGDAENLAQVVYDMSGGALTTGTFLVVGNGDFATAALNVSGLADVQVGSSLLVAVGDVASGAEGVMDVTSGSVSVGVLRDPTIPINTVGDNDLIVGAGSSSSGAMNVSGTAIIDVGGAMFVGGDTFNAGNGVLTQTGGEVFVGTLADPGNPPGTSGDDELLIGGGTGAVGLYDMSGGTLVAPGFVSLGVDGSVEAELRVSGLDTLVQLSGGGRAIELGAPTAVDVDDPDFGQPTAGLINQSGGTILMDGQLQIGSGPTALGVYDLSGGILDVAAATLMSAALPFEFEEGVLSTAESEFNQSGGESVFRAPIQVGDFGKATINLTGGTMTSDALGVSLFVGQNEFSAGTQVNFAGGTFVAQAPAVVGFLAAQDVEMNISGNADVTFGNLLLVAAVTEEDNSSSNEATINQSGGTFTVLGQLQLASAQPAEGQTEIGTPNGFYNMSGGQLNLPITAFLGVDGNGAFRQSGGLVESNDSIVIASEATANFSYELSGGTLDLNRQAIFMGDGNGTFEFTGGRLDGTAYLNFSLTQTGGVLATGSVPDDMITQIDGDFNISGDGAIEIQIGGFDPISQHDVIFVVGAATLGGSVNVSFVNGFSPQVGDAFEVLFSELGSITGEFDSLSFPALPGLDGRLIYDGPSVFLEVIEDTGGLLGDTNDDGVVDIVDLNNVRNNFGSVGLGDTDGNGTVDITDLNNVRNNFGAVAPSPVALSLEPGAGIAGYESSFRGGPHAVPAHLSIDGLRAEALTRGALNAADPTAVPEPSAWSLAVLASLGGMLAIRRKRG